MDFVDTHCHLDYNSLQADIEAVLQRAFEVGVNKIIVPGTDLASSKMAIKLADTYPFIYAAVGIHPNEAQQWQENALTDLRILANHPKVLAIGEIGLDFYRDFASPELQDLALREQLNLAAEVHKPIILHCREAMPALWPIISDWRQKLGNVLINRPGVFHSFDADLIIAKEIINAGFFIGVGGPITYKNALNRQNLITQLNLEKLVLETDAPFLPPHPYRGKINEPAYIPIIAEKIAQLKKCSIQLIADSTTRNAEFLFQWNG
ncbi:MAG: TatD family hydrolase [Anaerolineae bacterium]|nr:TatD family hydrolase [Anaerolineae bacterium]